MNFTLMYIKRKLLVHVRKWECVQVGNAQVGRAQKDVRNFFVRKWVQPPFTPKNFRFWGRDRSRDSPSPRRCYIMKWYTLLGLTPDTLLLHGFVVFFRNVAGV